MATIVCYDREGKAHSFASEDIAFRPAVYGIFIENDQVFLLKHPETNLFYPPGKILAEDEPPTQVVRQQFRKLTGLALQLGPLIFVEDQYVVDDEQQPWQLSLLYYALERPMITMAPTMAEVDDYEQPEWVLLDGLQRQQMQFGYEAIQAARLRLKL